ncbi:MAG: condensation domain-containing protein [Candidatus Aminicenantes bacterium]
MDAFVRQFGSNCSPRWISINWAEWQRENLAGDNELLISEAEGITTFERILTHSYLKQVIVSSGDLQARIDRWVHLSTLRREDRTGGEESLSTQARPNLLTPYIPPRTHLQQALVEIWKSIFGYEQIGIQDDFLELGGDSLKAILTISRIRKHLDLQVSLVAFFDRPTIEALSQHLSTAQKDRYISIPAAEKKEYYPLSSTQKRFYIIQQMNHRDKLLNMPELVRMEGNLNPDRLEGAFKALIARHETLRTSFCLTGNEVVQKIHPGVKFSIEYFHGSQEEIDPTVDTFIRPFDLNAPPLLRVGLMKLEEQKHLLLVDMHHIISDGISHQLLKEDFLLLYAGKDLLPLRLQYKDYSEWWNSQKHRETLKLQEDYWIKEFENPPPLAELPVDYSRKTITSFEGSMIKFNIDKEVTKTLKKMSAEEATSLFILLLAGFNVLIAKLSRQEDIVVGTVISGRNHVDLEGIIGSFVNLLALRNFPRAEKTFKEFLREVKQKTLASFENQDYQFEDLVDKLIDKRESNRFPLLNVGFTMQNLHMETGMPPGFDLPELKFIQYQYQRRSIKLDLNLEVYEWQDQLFFSLVYCNGLFKEETILEFGDYFKKIITEIIENSMKRIKEMGHYIRHRDESFSLPENRPREKILVEFDI